jgi:hypothetical protein
MAASKVEPFEEWSVGLAQPHLGLEQSGRPFVVLLLRFADGKERGFPFSIDAARQLSADLVERAAEAEGMQN